MSLTIQNKTSVPVRLARDYIRADGTRVLEFAAVDVPELDADPAAVSNDGEELPGSQAELDASAPDADDDLDGH